MRKLIGLSAVAMLAACNSAEDFENKPSTREWLALNNPMACSTYETKRHVLEIASSEYNAALAKGFPPLGFELISAADIRPDINLVSCEGFVSGRDYQGGSIGRVSILYTVQPDLSTSDGVIVRLYHAQEVGNTIQNHIQLWGGRDVDLSPERKKNPPEPSTGVSADGFPKTHSEHENDVVKERACPTKALQTVEDKYFSEITLNRGETYAAIWYLEEDKNTGETFYCGHRSQCFPTHVNIDGKRVRALTKPPCDLKEITYEDEEIKRQNFDF